MRLLLSLFLTFSLLFPTLNKLWILVDFKINQDFIAAVLCINKDKPKLNCHGKCHLSKQLKQAEKNAQKHNPPTLKEKHESVDLSFTRVKNNVFLKSAFQHVKYLYNFSLYVSPFIDEIFHPPSLMVVPT